MALLTSYSGGGPGARALVPNTLTSSDTFVYKPGAGQVLMLRNTTAGGLTPNLVGSAPVSEAVARGGAVNYAAGLTLASIPATTGFVEIPLDTIAGYLAGSGVVTVTGGLGLTAYLRDPSV